MLALRSFSLQVARQAFSRSTAARIQEQLSVLNVAKRPEQMNVPGWDLHPLKGDLGGHWSVKVSGNWRLTFRFEGDDAILVDYQDYH